MTAFGAMPTGPLGRQSQGLESKDKIASDMKAAYKAMAGSIVGSQGPDYQARESLSDMDKGIYDYLVRWGEDDVDTSVPEKMREYFARRIEGEYDSMRQKFDGYRPGLTAPETSSQRQENQKALRNRFEGLARIANQHGFKVDLSKYL